MKALCLAVGVLLLSACTSTGTVGIITRSMSDNKAMLTSVKAVQEIGVVGASSCRYFLGGVIPWGDGSLADAVDQAFARAGGDALINVKVETSLYGYIPLLTVFSYTCIKIEGLAVRFNRQP